ncbi:MAG TPA: hypothetical protein VKH37_06935, partial [Ferruginibacter sp.]|nr:hypothetical protein [Ferruginibacter sp.]
ETYSFEFNAGGSYTVTYANKKNESVTEIKGKWTFLTGGKKLKLYDNVQTGDTHLIADRILPVTKLTATQLVLKELLFGMDLNGTSYYSKQ